MQYLINHFCPPYGLKHALPSCDMKWRPHFFIPTIRFRLRHDQTLGNSPLFGLSFRKNIHYIVERCVTFLVYSVDLSHFLDQQVDNLKVRAHYCQMEGTSKNFSASRIDIRVSLYKDPGYLKVLFSQRDTEGCAIVLV